LETLLEAERPAVAGGADKSLVVWREQRFGEIEFPESPGRAEREKPQIWVIAGRFVDGNGAPIGDQFEIGFGGLSRPSRPDVTYNATEGEFLVTWRATLIFSKGGFRQLSFEPHVLAQRVSNDGTLPTEVPVDVHDLGNDSDDDKLARVAWASKSNTYLVVWDYDANFDRTFDSEEILGKRLNGDTAEVIDEEPLFLSPSGNQEEWVDVAYDPISDRWGTAFTARDFTERGSDDRRTWVTTTNAAGESDTPTAVSPFGLRSLRPAIAGNSVDGGFAVTWGQGTDVPNRIFGDNAEIFARRLDGNGEPVADQVAVSPLDDEQSFGSSPSIVHNGVANEYLIVWWNQSNRFLPRGSSELDEAWGRRMSNALAPLGDAEVISVLDVPFPTRGIPIVSAARQPVVGFNAASCTYLAAYDLIGNGAESVGSRAVDAPDCPVAMNPADSPVRPAQTTIPPSQVIVRSSVSCKSQRRFQIRLVRRKGRKYRSATVTLNGRRIATLRGKRLQAPVNLVGLAPGTVSVVIRARLTNGRVLRYTRRYRTCSPKLPPSNRLESASAV
jgi:hypothetical protein